MILSRNNSIKYQLIMAYRVLLLELMSYRVLQCSDVWEQLLLAVAVCFDV